MTRDARVPLSECVASLRPGGDRTPRTPLLGTFLMVVMIASGFGIGHASASAGIAPSGCDPGWYWIDEVDDSFVWQETFLPLRTASWTGSVQLLEEYDANCYVIGVEIAYTGPLGGGTLAIDGSLFVSYTVQYPNPFGDYADVAVNAYGDLDNWSPWTEPVVQPHFNINDRGADEFFIQGTGGPVVLVGVFASFSLPTDLLGSTVYAQIHVGWNLCDCSAVSFYLPGQAPPAPFDFDVSVDPASGTVLPGDSASAGVTATLTSGTPNFVTFDTSGLPADTVATFDPSGCDPTCTSAMTIFTSTTTPAGIYDVEVSASDGTITHTARYTLVVEVAPPPTVAWRVYVHAHEDDWQLFMAPDPYFDYQTGGSLLFIFVTAGDAGQGPSYWGAREQAAEASTRTLVGVGLTESSGPVTICYTSGSEVCHTVFEWTYGGTTTVFMRLPDGGVQGGGFPSTNYETLEKLRDGQIPSIGAVDASTRYDGWNDLTSTLAATIGHYAPYDATTRVAGPDFDRDRQTTHVDICPDCPDHADHLAVGDAVYAITIAAGAPWSRAWYIDYPIAWADSRYPENMDSASYTIKKQVFMAYSDEMKALTGVDEYSQMPWFWENCFHRNYSRTV